MVEPEVIENKIKKLQEFLGKLARLSKAGKDDFLSDFRNAESAK